RFAVAGTARPGGSVAPRAEVVRPRALLAGKERRWGRKGPPPPRSARWEAGRALGRSWRDRDELDHLAGDQAVLGVRVLHVGTYVRSGRSDVDRRARPIGVADAIRCRVAARVPRRGRIRGPRAEPGRAGGAEH